MYDVTAIGELLIDFACKSTDEAGYPTMAANAGGAPANFLAALNACGCSTAFLGKVGKDTFGKLLIGTLKNVGIETKGIIMDSNVFTTLAFVTIDKTGNRDFSFARKPGADVMLKFDELDLSLIDNCKDFHFGTLSLTDEPVRSTTQKAVEYAKKQNKLISFDPNLRKPLWNDLEQAKKYILWGLSQADIVKISDEEIEFLWGCSKEEAAQKLHNDFGVKIVFITLGSQGCYYSGNGNSGTVSIPKGIKPVDTTGAGDIFGGSAVGQLLKLNRDINTISNAELYNITEFACCAASLSTEHYGGISSIQTTQNVKDYLENIRG